MLLSVSFLLFTANMHAVGLAKVYDDAKAADPVLGASRANFQAVKEKVPQARSRILPSLNAGFSTQKNEIDFSGAIDSNPFSPNFGNPIPGENFNENGWNACIDRVNCPDKFLQLRRRHRLLFIYSLELRK